MIGDHVPGALRQARGVHPYTEPLGATIHPQRQIIDTLVAGDDHLATMSGRRTEAGEPNRLLRVRPAPAAASLVLALTTLPWAASAAVTGAATAAPTGTLSFSLPELATAGKAFKIVTSMRTTSREVGLYLDLKPLPSAGPQCARSHVLEPPTAMLIVNGSRAPHASTPTKLMTAGVYVACAWLESPHGTVDGPFAGRVVIMAAHQHPTAYTGTTSQGLPASQLHGSHAITFDTIDHQIVKLSYFARYTCIRVGKPTGHPVYSTTFEVFGIDSTGQFVGTFAAGSDHAIINGQLRRGGAATGSFTESYMSGGYQCSSGAVQFTAHQR
jgi:hypothetical protein